MAEGIETAVVNSSDREKLSFDATGNGNIGKYEASNGGFEFFSYYSSTLIPTPTVAMGIRFSVTGNSITLGQSLSFVPPQQRRKEDFFFLGAFYTTDADNEHHL